MHFLIKFDENISRFSFFDTLIYPRTFENWILQYENRSAQDTKRSINTHISNLDLAKQKKKTKYEKH